MAEKRAAAQQEVVQREARLKTAVIMEEVRMQRRYDSLLPPVDTPGKWACRPNRDSFDYRSFGAFECVACEKRWVSARAHSKYHQACQGCESEVMADFMWVNAPGSQRKTEKMELDPEKPHDSGRCGACAAGECSAAVAGFSDAGHVYLPINGRATMF